MSMKLKKKIKELEERVEALEEKAEESSTWWWEDLVYGREETDCQEKHQI